MRHIDIGSTINSGIYIITNRANGHQYVGSAVNIDKRWAVHRSLLRRNNHNANVILMTIADESAERNSHTYETDLLNPQKILQS